MTILTILVAAFILRLVLSPFGSHPIDVPDWIGWSNRLTEVPLNKFYDEWSDYLPGYLYVLWVLGLGKNFLITIGVTIKEDVIYKLPAILVDCATGYLIFVIGKKYFDQKRALAFASLYLFNPAIIYNSALWGQTDSLTAFFSILALFLVFEKKLILSSLSFTYSFLAKPVGLLVGLLVGLILFKRQGLKNTSKFGLISIIVTLVAFIPFLNRTNFFQFISERLDVTFGQYPYTSLTSFNFWYLIASEFWQSDQLKWAGVTYQFWGFVIFGIFSLIGILLLLKNWTNNERSDFEWSIISATLIYAAGSLFLTRVHERQLHSAITFLAAAAVFRPQLLIYYLIYSVTYIADLRLAFVLIAENWRYIFTKEIIYLFSILNLATFGAFLTTVLLTKLPNEKLARQI